MNWVKIGLLGIANALLLGLIWRLPAFLFPMLPLNLFIRGVGSGILMGPLIWALAPRHAAKTLTWRRLGLAYALADIAVIGLALPGAWLVATLELAATRQSSVLVQAVTWGLAWGVSLAIASRVLDDRVDNRAQQVEATGMET